MKILLSIFFLITATFAAHAASCNYASQGYVPWWTTASGTPINMSIVDDLTGTSGCANTINIGLVGGKQVVNNAIAVSPPARGARNFPGCSVGTSSVQCLAASTAVSFVQIQNNSTAAVVACAWGTTAVLNNSGSFQLGAGQSASWGINTAGVPTGALNCIATAAATPVYVEWN